jgi:hypothetical protein
MPIIPISGSAVARGSLIPLGSVRLANSSTSTVVFSNIPQGYQDLCIVANIRSDFEANFPAISVYYNIPASPNFFSQNLMGTDGSSSYAATLTTSTPTFGVWYTFGRGVAGAYTAPSTYATIKIDVLGYANTNTFKTSLGRLAGDVNLAGNTLLSTSRWASTTAINAVTVGAQGNYIAGSTFNLYGVRSVNQ